MDSIGAFLSFCLTLIIVIIILVWAFRYPHEVAGAIHWIGAFISGVSNWIGKVVGDLQSGKYTTR